MGGQLEGAGLELSTQVKSIGPFSINQITNDGILCPKFKLSNYGSFFFETCLLNLDGVFESKTYIDEVDHQTQLGTKGYIGGRNESLGIDLLIGGIYK